MKKYLTFIILILSSTLVYSNDNISNNNDYTFTNINRIFPLNNYSQNLDYWFNIDSKDYNKLAIATEIQLHYFNVLKKHFYGINSPWSKTYINYLIQPEPKTGKTIFKGEEAILSIYANNINTSLINESTLYSMNFRRLDENWIKNIMNNMDIKQFKNLVYNNNKRAISVDNIIIRSIPTNDPGFNHYSIPGSGYPFDLFNLSLIPVGTPIYIFGTSKDKAWYFIVSPSGMGWVKASKVALVDKNFINVWTTHANKNLTSIITSDIGIFSGNSYKFSALVGTLLPVHKTLKYSLIAMIPIKNSSGMGIIKYTTLNKRDAVIVPLPLNMKNFSRVVKTLIGRYYGWGGNNLYNDCSLELISIYKVFGIFLPRNSSAQASYSGQMIDISKLPVNERIQMITKNAIPFATLLYIKGHIMIYIGSYNTTYGNDTIMTYQNIWGLSPKDKSYREIIGKAVIFPLLNEYPEAQGVTSLIDKETVIMINLIKPYYNKFGLSSLLY